MWTFYNSRFDASDTDSLLSVNYAGFAPVLVEGLKELEAKQRLETESLKELLMEQKQEILHLKDQLLLLVEPRQSCWWRFWKR